MTALDFESSSLAADASALCAPSISSGWVVESTGLLGLVVFPVALLSFKGGLDRFSLLQGLCALLLLLFLLLKLALPLLCVIFFLFFSFDKFTYALLHPSV